MMCNFRLAIGFIFKNSQVTLLGILISYINISNDKEINFKAQIKQISVDANFHVIN